MAKGTIFGDLHTNIDLHLIQVSANVGPAVPRVNIIDVPGANGGVDLSEALGGVTFQDRELSWVFAPYPGDNWAATRSAVETALNGRAFDIILDNDPEWVYTGRVSVDSYEADQILHRITVHATCRPYRLRREGSSHTETLSAAGKEFPLDFGSMAVSPRITNTGDCALTWDGRTYNLTAGSRVYADMRVTGRQTFRASGSGSLTFEWREGSL